MRLFVVLRNGISHAKVHQVGGRGIEEKLLKGLSTKYYVTVMHYDDSNGESIFTGNNYVNRLVGREKAQKTKFYV